MDDKQEHIRQLEQRIDELEATIRKMLPSRRDALKLGGAAAIGAATMSGSASAGSNSTGDITGPVDIEAEDITQVDTINGNEIITSGDSVDRVIFVIDQGGSDPGAATNDDIILEKE
jgi:hypothetical protein